MNDIDKTMETIKERMNRNSDVITKLIVEAPQCIRIEEYYKVDNEKKELQYRINKAIEYIEDDSLFNGSGICANDLLDILRGEDNE